MGKTRIAVAGAGLIGRAHVAALRDSESCCLHAVVDPSPSAIKIAADAGVPYFESLDALLAHSRPDGVILATPNALHVPQALQCVAAGLPTLVEKPIAPTVAEAQRLVDAVQACKGRVLVGHHRAHSLIMACAAQVIQAGQLGRLVTVAGSATFYKPDNYFADGPWRSQTGGGPILINMIHEVHNLRMLCGEITAVQAFASNAVRGFAVEDTVAINLRFASGVLGTFMLSDTAAGARSWEQTSGENKDFPSYEDEDCYVISGTQGTLSVPTMRLKTYAQNEERSWWKPLMRSVVSIKNAVRADPIALQMEHFGAVVRGEVAPLVTVQDGLANLRVTEAISRAAKCGQIVQL